MELIRCLNKLKEDKREVEKAVKDAEAELLCLLGNAEAFVYLADPDELGTREVRVLHWKEESAGSRFDSKAFQKEYGHAMLSTGERLAEAMNNHTTKGTRRMWRDKPLADYQIGVSDVSEAIRSAEEHNQTIRVDRTAEVDQ
jgi:hypothetical protein